MSKSELVLGSPNLLGESSVVAARSGVIEVRVMHKAYVEPMIRAGHYSGTSVWSSNLHMGVFAEGDRIGAMQFGPGMNPTSGKSIVSGTTPDTWIELNRLWLQDDKPPNTGSRAIACALRIIRHQRPRVEWVQSFADERCGKLGGIYQASNFLYLGEHTSDFYEVDGVTFHKSMLARPASDARGWRPGPKVAWAKQNASRATVVTYRQFRYVKFLQTRARRRLLLPELPYPKPDADVMDV